MSDQDDTEKEDQLVEDLLSQGTAPEPEPDKIDELTNKELAKLEKAKDKIRRTSYRYVTDALAEAIGMYTEDAVQELARSVLGEDFWLGVKMAKKLRHGEIEGLPALSQTLSILVGAYTPVNIASGMLHARREEEGAIAYLKAKEMGYTDGTSSEYARVRIGKLRTQEKAFEALAQALLEQINVVKKLHERELQELQHLGRHQF